MSLPATAWRALRRRLAAWRLTLDLLLGRRLALFALIDAAVVLAGLFSMLLQPDGSSDSPYHWMFLFPFLALGLPALAGMVEVDRRAGCLDLALSAPAAERYFVRRAAAVGGALALQGTAMIVLGWIADGGGFPLVAPLLSLAAASAFLTAVALFWAVRLRSAGAVWLASLATAALAGRWLFADPLPPRQWAAFGRFLPGLEAALPWLADVAVLAAAAVVFFLYARRRLRRPETMLS